MALFRRVAPAGRALSLVAATTMRVVGTTAARSILWGEFWEQAFGVVNATLPPLTANISCAHGVSGTTSATLDPLTPSITGAHGVAGTVNATLPSLAAGITAGHGVSGTGAGALQGLQLDAQGAFVVWGPITATLPPLVLSAAGSHGIVGAINSTLPDLVIVMTGETSSLQNSTFVVMAGTDLVAESLSSTDSTCETLTTDYVSEDP